MYICTCLYVYMCMCIYIYIYIYTHIHVGTHTCRYHRSLDPSLRGRLPESNKCIYIYIYIYIHIYTCVNILEAALDKRLENYVQRTLRHVSCLRSPMREFPVQMKVYKTYIIPEHNAHIMFNGFHLKGTSPQGDLKQETYRKHPVLHLAPLTYMNMSLFA